MLKFGTINYKKFLDKKECCIKYPCIIEATYLYFSINSFSDSFKLKNQIIRISYLVSRCFI